MSLLRNILLYISFAVVVVGCGGGNTTIAANNNSTSSSNTGGASTSGATSTTSSSSGSITLKWTAPITRADNSPVSLSDISGYRLYYGPSATNTPGYINISDGTATQYTVTLPSGTYYFRVAAIDTNGFEGLATAALQKSL